MNNIKKTLSALCLGAALLAAPVAAYAQDATVESPSFQDLQTEGVQNAAQTQYDQTRQDSRTLRRDQRQDSRDQRRAQRTETREGGRTLESSQLGNTIDHNLQQGREIEAYQAQRAVEDARNAQALERAQDKYSNKFDNKMLAQDAIDILTRATSHIIQNQTYNAMRAQEDAAFGDMAREEDAAARDAYREYDRNLSAEIDRARAAQQTEMQNAEQLRQMDVQEFNAMQNAESGAFRSAQSSETSAAASNYSDRATAQSYSASTTNQATTLGQAIFNFGSNIVNAPTLFYLMSYMCGAYFMAIGLLKANKAAMEPSQNPLSNAVKFMVAGAFLSALPATTQILKNGFGLDGSAVFDLIYAEGLKGASGQAAADGTTGAEGLDMFMVNLIKDITRPMMTVINLVCYAAGVFLLFSGLQRLVKGSDQGPKGPAGLGTLMNFAVGAALISFAPTLDLVLNSVFGDAATVTVYPDMSAMAAKLSLETEKLAQTQAVITALLAFLTIVGLISFARGLFMLKDAADGSQNASLMGSMSHMIAGVCCVNFGAFANMLQTTLNLTGFGIEFQ